jgi:hypothetical protein
MGRRPLESYRLDLGLYTLDEEGSGRRWRPTPLVEQFRALVASPAEAVGELALETVPA